MTAFAPQALHAFAALYPNAPGKIAHGLVDHPLFTLDALAALSERLAAETVEYNRADLPIGVDPDAIAANGLGPSETIRSIEANGSWMVLKFVERDADYRALLMDTLDELSAVVRPATGAMLSPQGFIFISSPDAVTPFHFDPEHNILLQLRGEKTMTVFPACDEALVSGEEHERFHLGGHRNLPWRDDFAPKGEAFRLVPGNGLHVPVKAPHWVKNGPAVSISFSITWRSRWSYAEADARGMNALLRRRGAQPSPPSPFPARNAAKALAYRTVRRLRG